MNPFHHKHHQLHIENVALATIAEKVKPPFYAYSASAIRSHYRAFVESCGQKAQICYSVKANSNQAILRLLAREGAGVDIVSEGEGRRALSAGIDPKSIFFSGVGKSDSELRFALKNGLAQINIESQGELERLALIAEQENIKAPIALRINPDIDAQSHDKISTGRANDKFGIALEQIPELYQKASKRACFHVQGLAIHIGSQIIDMDIFSKAFHLLGECAQQLRKAELKIGRLDLGGGLGISKDRCLREDISAYGALARSIAKKFDCEIIASPGRAIVGGAGCLVASVVEQKKAGDKDFLILNAAMNDFIRPALYDAHHPVLSISSTSADFHDYDLVGPVCETGDVLAKNIRLPQQKKGDLIAIMQAGAYGAVLSSYYNSRLLIPEIIVEGDRFAICRRRQDYQDLINMDHIPDWLA